MYPLCGTLLLHVYIFCSTERWWLAHTHWHWHWHWHWHCRVILLSLPVFQLRVARSIGEMTSVFSCSGGAWCDLISTVSCHACILKRSFAHLDSTTSSSTTTTTNTNNMMMMIASGARQRLFTRTGRQSNIRGIPSILLVGWLGWCGEGFEAHHPTSEAVVLRQGIHYLKFWRVCMYGCGGWKQDACSI